MSRQPLRYFVNDMDDWVEGFGREVEVDTKRWTNEAFAYVQAIVQNLPPTLQVKTISQSVSQRGSM